MGKLTTHVLDTANGRPGAGIKVELFALSGDTRRALKTTTTNDDGRCDQPLLEGDALVAGEYELVFGAGDYFASIGTKSCFVRVSVLWSRRPILKIPRLPAGRSSRLQKGKARTASASKVASR